MSAGIFVGRAKPPSGTLSGRMHAILSVVCELEGRCFSGTQKAFIQALRDVATRYRAQAGTHTRRRPVTCSAPAPAGATVSLARPGRSLV